MRHVIVLAALLILPLQAYAAEGSMFISPGRVEIERNEQFQADIRINTDGQAVNAGEALVRFNAAALSVEEISTVGSIFTLWPTPVSYSNEEGTIRFAGWGDRFIGEDGLVLSITFRAKTIGTHGVRFDSGAVLAADGQGSNILTSMRSGSYIVTAEVQEPALEAEPQPAVLGAETVATSTVVEESALEPMPAPPPKPTFFESTRSMGAGERLVLEGNAIPNAEVTVYLQRGTENIRHADIMSEQSGAFTYISDEPLQEGVYRLWAVARDVRGQESEKSDRVTITARHQGFAAAAYVGADILGAILPYVALVVLGGLIIGFIVHHRSRKRLQEEDITETSA